MGFLCGFLGAFLGAILGIACALLAVSFHSDGNDLAEGLAFMGLALIGIIIGAIAGIVLALQVRRYAAGHWEGRQVRRKTSLIIASSVIAVPVLMPAIFWEVARCHNPPPDQQLLNNFYRHRPNFVQLVRMKQADPNLTRVDYSWTEPSDPQTIHVSPARIMTYRRLLETAGLHRGFDAYHPKEVDFLYWCEGSAISSDTDKGYAYLTVPPKQVLTTLDDCQPDEENGVKAYYHIEGCWYLYYDYLPG